MRITQEHSRQKVSFETNPEERVLDLSPLTPHSFDRSRHVASSFARAREPQLHPYSTSCPVAACTYKSKKLAVTSKSPVRFLKSVLDYDREFFLTKVQRTPCTFKGNHVMASMNNSSERPLRPRRSELAFEHSTGLTCSLNSQRKIRLMKVCLSPDKNDDSK